MKIAILNDTHWGSKNDSKSHLDYQEKFYYDIFFPYLKENNINTLVHLGDVIDRRKFINFNTAYRFKKFMFKLWEEKIDTHIILGNHDTYFKNTNEVNSIDALCKSFDGVNEPWIYYGPKVVTFDGTDILFLPWICDDNHKESLEAIKNSKTDLCFGHLEIKGFEMHNGLRSLHGLDSKVFKKFDKVISGHFHTKSDDGQIHYLGTQFELNWSDYRQTKGFHIFDTETREIEYIKNPHTLHNKLIYDDSKNDYKTYDLTQYNNHYVKVIVIRKDNPEMFDKLIERLYNDINVYELQIIDDFTSMKASVRSDILEMGEDTHTFLNNYIDQLDVELDKQKLKDYMKSLYVEVENT